MKVIVFTILFLFPVSLLAVSQRIQTCADYHCDEPVPVHLSPVELDSVKQLFKQTTNAEEERHSIALAIGKLESIIGSKNGTWKDIGRNPGSVHELQGQLDCISESQNSTTYLKLLDTLKTLRWHKVEERVVRRRYVFGTHWTAVIREVKNDEQYAVDSWHDDNGMPARIIPLDLWFDGAESAL